MDDAQDQLARAATALASHLPFSVMKSLSDAIIEYQELEWPMTRTRILQAIPTPHFRDLAADFLAYWKTEASETAPQAVALVLLTSAHAEEYHRQQQVVEGVWTGPDLPDTTFRQTEPAVLEVLNGATERITLVSYAVYRIPRIRNALVQAAFRGVDITLVVETPNRLDGQNEYDCVLALGGKVAAVSTVYYWPQENREHDENGKHGILHVKCAVADGKQMFLSSANLTEYAFSINMELGMLVTGGKLPAQVEKHFHRLIETGVLVKV
ncbi:unnamed protein product [marine sediment metagenome]|uniref:PLD phosphodiesterase domain-containing protein n=1 Tax=marine sediment metagenome TaxID=412755 RepID=X0T600_9ZZZZ